MSQEDIISKLRLLEEEMIKKNNIIKNYENKKVASQMKLNVENTDQILNDRTRLMTLIENDLPELRTITHSLHNGVRHDLYCNCITCRLCSFCSVNKKFKNKSGCLTHYGLRHKEFKDYWKTDF
jgi:hypothetical protein